MRILLGIFVTAALLLSQLAWAGTYLKEEQRVSGLVGQPPQNIVIESWYEGDKVKKKLAGTGMTFIIDLKKHDVVVLQPTQRRYFKVPPQSYQMMTQASLQAFGVTRNPDGSVTVPKNVFKVTGKKKRIGKWKAYEVVVNAKLPNGGRVTMWFSQDVGLNQEDLVSSLKGAMGGDSKQLEPFFKEIAALKGYPVLSTAEFDVNGQRVVLTQSVKKAEKRTIAKGEFVIPKDYTKVDNPMGMQGMQPPPAKGAPTKGAVPGAN